MTNEKYNEGDLRVWHIPQIPGNLFIVDVATPEEAHKIINMLADYDAFQYENRIKPDYSNASGLDVLEDGDWFTWYDTDGFDLREHINNLKESE
ncbi:MAG: hypothetical protein GY938_03865 [Ketobacter sp.]|nr:hypothetical protein [Ketobacter sp.]